MTKKKQNLFISSSTYFLLNGKFQMTRFVFFGPEKFHEPNDAVKKRYGRLRLMLYSKRAANFKTNAGLVF